MLTVIAFGNVYGQVSKESWVDSKMAKMTLEEKIGQLFSIRAHSDLGRDHINSVKEQIKKYHVGGLCFFQGSPDKQAELTNEYQRLSNLPLMISIDGEWGLGMRFPKNTVSFPRQLMLGAIRDDNLIYEMGKEVAAQMKRVGIHMNFAPVVDVNNNPDNPVINNRSFGENRLKVSAKSYAYMKGMQDGGLLTCAKHFPGHGDTSVDSHYDLPVIPHPRSRLDSIELMPFQQLINQGVDGIMVAHLSIPALDDAANRPTTLSKKVITNLLQKEMGFDGLVFTDAMEMKALTKFYKNGRAEVEAIKAGNDVILLPANMDLAFSEVKKAVDSGEISISRIEESCRKVLSSKFDLGLLYTPIVADVQQVMEDINSSEAVALRSNLVQKAMTIVKNDQTLFPITEVNDKKALTVSIGTRSRSAFQTRVGSFVKSDHLSLSHDQVSSQQASVISRSASYDYVFVSLEDMSKYSSKNFGLNEATIQLINTLASSKTKVILTVFGSPYALKYFGNVPNVLLAYEDDDQAQDIAAQALFGVFEVNGVLPVTVSPVLQEGHGIYSPPLSILGYATPEEVGMSSDSLMAIDTIVDEMLRRRAAPGCQVLVAKDGKIVLQKAYGHHTYDRKIKVKTDDIYDLASVTKIMASTISLMRLAGQDKFNIYKPLKQYIAEADTSNKSDIIIEDILAHHAGLAGWVPFYKNTLDPKKKKATVDKKYYSKTLNDSFGIEVTDDLYLRSDYRDSIWSRILGTQLREKRNYRYSDLGFYMMHETINNITGKPIDQYTQEEFYGPLGLTDTGYNPLLRHDNKRIPPTEKDNYFRGQVVDGYVHDMGAAMLGGVSGHAGLFSNTGDLAVLAQMLLNGGSYGGKQFIEPKTIKKFTERYYRSTRRGIGFDMKELDENRKLNMSEKATESTFGHLGFTGTCMWMDPENDLIFIFLSNRTFPSMNNNTFGKYEFRPRIQTVVYNSIIADKESSSVNP
jgi:beta-glucosidase-like glycosyl hydrolase/CubicO group peptidase (beta-lactamase class C family)